MIGWLTSRLRASVGARAALLAAVVLAMIVPVGLAASAISGPAGLLAAVVAALACLIGAVAALVVCHLLRGPAFALQTLLLGMLLRMGLPLVIALTSCLSGGRLLEAGLPIYLVVFYPVTLAAETILSLPRWESGACRVPSTGIEAR